MLNIIIIKGERGKSRERERERNEQIESEREKEERQRENGLTVYSWSWSSVIWPKTERRRVVWATKFNRCLRLLWVESRPVRFCSSSSKESMLVGVIQHKNLAVYSRSVGHSERQYVRLFIGLDFK
jgi:hypothetical protein